ncbi:uncharacterized protein LOC143850517 [Tasmannia lanceolata]|uniref:uncharacterized protein LOC143850517 n=1 Tax=Tasmannia lanceolata TaxID=3420 RepID=UPI0040648932
MKKFADAHRTEREFEVGDWVYLRLQPFRQTTVAVRQNMKLASRYYGPLRVLQRVGMVAYRLEVPEGSRIHSVFHVSLLKKKLGSHSVALVDLPHVDNEGRVRLEPVAILDRKMVKRGNRAVTQVLVQWSNTYPEDATWEYLRDLQQQFLDFRP